MSRNESYAIPSATRSIKEILEDPSTSHWLKDALASSINRDPVDMRNDIDVLLGIYANMLYRG